MYERVGRCYLTAPDVDIFSVNLDKIKNVWQGSENLLTSEKDCVRMATEIYILGGLLCYLQLGPK